METARRFVGGAPTRFAAYVALQCALMRRFIARGGTAEEFCLRLAPAFHRRYAPLLLEGDAAGALLHFRLCTTVRVGRISSVATPP